jgi:hypothetical protein
MGEYEECPTCHYKKYARIEECGCCGRIICESCGRGVPKDCPNDPKRPKRGYGNHNWKRIGYIAGFCDICDESMFGYKRESIGEYYKKLSGHESCLDEFLESEEGKVWFEKEKQARKKAEEEKRIAEQEREKQRKAEAAEEAEQAKARDKLYKMAMAGRGTINKSQGIITVTTDKYKTTYDLTDCDFWKRRLVIKEIIKGVVIFPVCLALAIFLPFFVIREVSLPAWVFSLVYCVFIFFVPPLLIDNIIGAIISVVGMFISPWIPFYLFKESHQFFLYIPVIIAAVFWQIDKHFYDEERSLRGLISLIGIGVIMGLLAVLRHYSSGNIHNVVVLLLTGIFGK